MVRPARTVTRAQCLTRPCLEAPDAAGLRFFSEINKLYRQAEQGEVDEAAIKSANNVAGILFHYPAGQVQRTFEGAIALSEGETDNPLAVVTGAP